MTNAITTIGFAQLTETPAVLSDGHTYWPAPAADTSLPAVPVARLYKARVYPGIWVQEDAHAAVVLYRRWFDANAVVAIGYAQEVKANKTEIARLDLVVQAAQELASFHEAAVQAAKEKRQLPDPPDSASDEVKAVLRIVADASPEYWEAAGVIQWLEDISEMMAELVATISLNLEYLEESQRLHGAALEAIGAPPVPYVECFHDGTHVVDLPECFTIGADRGEEPGMDELTNKDKLTDSRVRRAVVVGDEATMVELLGDDWRAAPTTVRQVSDLTHRTPGYIYQLCNGKPATIGVAWDYKRRMDAIPVPMDYDTLSQWSTDHEWPLTTYRNDVLHFMRTAASARWDGKPLADARTITKAFERWGVHWRTVVRWLKDPWWDGRHETYWGSDKVSGGRFRFHTFTVDNVLDWFLIQSQRKPVSESEDIIRTYYRLVRDNLRRRVGQEDVWEGAVNLQRAWNYYHAMLPLTVGGEEDETERTPRRLDNYIGQALQLLAENDPDWAAPPIDDRQINPTVYYAVWLPPTTHYDDTTVHTPVTVVRLKVLLDTSNPYWAVGIRRRAVAKNLDPTRIAITKGDIILSRPYAYTL